VERRQKFYTWKKEKTICSHTGSFTTDFDFCCNLFLFVQTSSIRYFGVQIGMVIWGNPTTDYKYPIVDVTIYSMGYIQYGALDTTICTHHHRSCYDFN